MTMKIESTRDLRALAEPQPAADKIANRKIKLLTRSGLFGQDLKGAVVSRACSSEDLRLAYRLVHDVYLRTGFLAPEPGGIRLRIFETSPETATFIAKVGDRVVGVLSVVGDSPDLGLPSDVAFKAELDVLRENGRKLCELTNQAVVEGYRNSAVPAELMRCATAHCLQAGYQDGVAAVTPSHNGFYRLLGFRQLGSVRSYSNKLHDPVLAVTRHIDRTEAGAPGQSFAVVELIGRNPFLDQVAAWAQRARCEFLNPKLLKDLFAGERNFLGECTPGELQSLQQRWGQELFSAVVQDVQPRGAN